MIHCFWDNGLRDRKPTGNKDHLPPLKNPDHIQITFDDHRLVINAGLLLPAALAQRVGLRELVDHHLDLGGVPGRANTGDKLLTLGASALVARPEFSTEWSRRHPPWPLSSERPRQSTRPREPLVADPGLTATLN